MPSPASIRISIAQARDYLVRLHFSCAESDAAAGICDQDNDDRILAAVRRLGCVQYDPLNVVGRIRAPLDNLIWDRRMIRELFGFDYTWEVYTPVDKRRYGYYVLPVMYGSRFVARFEPERHRPGRPLTLRKWWWEPDAGPDAEIRSAVASALERFARYLDATGVEMDCPF